MIKKEYKRLLKSKGTVLAVLSLCILFLISFAVSMKDKQMFIAQMSDTSPDLNKAALSALIEQYTGAKFVSNFWLVSDFYILFIMVLFLWVGIFLSSTLLNQKETGAGNLIIIRTNFRTYLNSVLVAQTLLIFTVIGLSTLLTCIASVPLGGLWKSLTIGRKELGVPQMLLFLLAQSILVATFTALVNGICLLSDAWIKSKYVLQAMPIFLFFLFPQLISSTIGNLIVPLGLFLGPFVPTQALRRIEYILYENFSFASIAFSLIPLLVYAVLLAILYVLNVKKHRESYL